MWKGKRTTLLVLEQPEDPAWEYGWCPCFGSGCGDDYDDCFDYKVIDGKCYPLEEGEAFVSSDDRIEMLLLSKKEREERVARYEHETGRKFLPDRKADPSIDRLLYAEEMIEAYIFDQWLATYSSRRENFPHVDEWDEYEKEGNLKQAH